MWPICQAAAALLNADQRSSEHISDSYRLSGYKYMYYARHIGIFLRQIGRLYRQNDVFKQNPTDCMLSHMLIQNPILALLDFIPCDWMSVACCKHICLLACATADHFVHHLLSDFVLQTLSVGSVSVCM